MRIKLLQVILKHLPTKKTYLFTCDRWLNLQDPEGSLVCEMPALGPDIAHSSSGEFTTYL